MHMYVCAYTCICVHTYVYVKFLFIYTDIFLYIKYVHAYGHVCVCIYYLGSRYQQVHIPTFFLSLNEKLFSELYFFFQASHNGNIPFLIAQLSYTQSFWCNFQGYDHTKLCFFHDSKIEVSTFTAVFPGFHFSA